VNFNFLFIKKSVVASKLELRLSTRIDLQRNVWANFNEESCSVEKNFSSKFISHYQFQGHWLFKGIG